MNERGFCLVVLMAEDWLPTGAGLGIHSLHPSSSIVILNEGFSRPHQLGVLRCAFAGNTYSSVSGSGIDV
ncbi:hypothetical protein Tco_1040853 [Tanacetum coccineum]|uniref:Uncharacterized protein n=1 Tax=Tanacetum coccineum TaxID=301880 RepID=A0ABQ5GEJ9_9ASTR